VCARTWCASYVGVTEDAMCKASGRKNRETRAVARTTGDVIAFGAQGTKSWASHRAHSKKAKRICVWSKC